MQVQRAIVGAAGALAAWVTCTASFARAEPAPGGEGASAAVASAAAPAAAEPAPEDQRAQGRGIQYGLHLLVASPLHGVLAEDFAVGFGLQGRIGWELPSGLSLEVDVGYQGFGVQDYEVGGADSDDSIGALYAGVGARFAFLNPTAFVPFVGAGLATNLWIVPTETEFFGRSGQYYCGSDFACELAPGGSGESAFGGVSLLGNVAAGGIYEITAKIAIEAGAQYSIVMVPGPFDQARGANFGYLTFFAGGTLYYD